MEAKLLLSEIAPDAAVSAGTAAPAAKARRSPSSQPPKGQKAADAAAADAATADAAAADVPKSSNVSGGYTRLHDATVDASSVTDVTDDATPAEGGGPCAALCRALGGPCLQPGVQPPPRAPLSPPLSPPPLASPLSSSPLAVSPPPVGEAAGAGCARRVQQRSAPVAVGVEGRAKPTEHLSRALHDAKVVPFPEGMQLSQAGRASACGAPNAA